MFKDYVPKFVKKYADVGTIMTEAFQRYDKEVKEGSFPDAAHSFTIKDDVLEKLY